MMVGMGYIGLDSGRLYRMRRGPKLIEAVASGTTIIISDATEGRPFRGLRVFGKSTQDGTPTPEAPVPIVSVGDSRSIKVEVMGKNLFDINSLKKYEVDNNDLKASVDNDKIVLEGKGVTTTEVIFFCLNKTDDLLKLNPGKYTLSFKSNMPMGTAHKSKTVEAFAIIKKADGSSDYSSTGSKGWTTFDIAEGDMMYFRFDINNGTMTAEFYDIQLEYGSSATAYEPYRTPQILTLQTPNGLPGVPVSKDGNYTDADGQQYICDEINLARGKYVQRVKKINVKSVNGYNLSENFGSIKVEGILSTQSRVPVMSNRFAFGTSIKDDGTCFAYGDVIRLYYNLGSLENFNKWLTDNDVVVWYPLDTFIERDLTPEEIAAYKALRTYGPTTVVSNDAGAEMEITYRKDKKNEKTHWNKVD